MKAQTGKIQPLIVRTISDQLYDILREQILSGALAADQPIRQDAVAAELNISKIPLRETLARLEQDGLVVAHAKRGFTVATLSASEAEEVFELRIRLEPEAAAKSSLVATAADHKAARLHLSELESVIRHKDQDHSLYNRLFHLSLVQPGAGRLTYRVLETISVIADRYVRLHLSTQGRDKRAVEEHRQLLKAWINRDAVEVETLLTRHIADTLNDLRNQLASESAIS
ncbi:GntR family transcriptional regulator [Gluconobacter japonicus]|uniref:GntR family transcriptional regulator n=1 Tax=Gluconobacter japonicus TaxID=376620 RepID=UPI0024AD8BCB|nr:GntR family transcriptional regulator [Gluconobacter japonicus]MDI6653174.1 GntR family transcriptional regulator [Gluconobacter japonicus]